MKYVCFTLLLLPLFLPGQIHLEKRYGIPPSELSHGQCIVRLGDGYIIAGLSVVNGYPDRMLLRTNGIGDTVWTRVWGNAPTEQLDGIVATGNGQFACIGQSRLSVAGSPKPELVRADTAGNILTTRRYTLPQMRGGAGYDIVHAPNGDLLFCGSITDSSYWVSGLLVRTDSMGNLIWEQRIVSPGAQAILHAVDAVSAGGYVAAGSAWVGPSGVNEDFFVVRSDEAGNTLWTRKYDITGNADRIYDIRSTSDGGFVAFGTTLGGWKASTVIKMDSLGGIQWLYDSHLEGADAILEHTDGSFFAAGNERGAVGLGQDAAIVQLSPEGAFICHFSIGEGRTEAFHDILEKPGGEITVVGYKKHPVPSYYTDVYLLELTVCPPTAVEGPDDSWLVPYPNPASEMLAISADATTLTSIRRLTLIDVAGRRFRFPFSAGNPTIDCSSLPAGHYVLSIELSDGPPIRKKIVLH